MKINEVIEEIARLPQDWHGAGTVSHPVLETIWKHAEALGEIQRSVETGSGKTTLLFCRLSSHHTVFACDFGNSISKVRESSLFKKERVVFVEGPTQRTLPTYTFDHPLCLALIDGPHGYPFPDMEYYYFYPQIKEGGLLLVDDIQIPSIRRMYDIIEAGEMFDLLEVVDNMAFFRRTAAPLINPYGDNWWLQGYNKAAYEAMMNCRKPQEESGNAIQSPSFMQFLAKNTPAFARALVPRKVKRRLLGK